MKPEIRDLSLYIHIPFCKAKCIYCDFLSFGGCGHDKQKQYIDALCKEIEIYSQTAKEYLVRTIFIGGGTPSYIDADLMEQVMQTIYRVFQVAEDAEITMEGNPDSLKEEKLKIYKQAGINRLSIGLQSADDAMLRTLGRVHSYEQFIKAYQCARKIGFHNINVDVMSGLPGETEESYLHTLEKVLNLEPEHISAYSLIVEEETPLNTMEELLKRIPSEEEDRRMYAKTKELLQKNGYKRYEISNYAKEGFECRHNTVYWTGGEYLGVGLGASSYLTVWLNEDKYKKIRFHGVESIDEYIGRFSNCDGMQEDTYTNIYHFYEEESDEYGDWDVFDAFGGMETQSSYDEYEGNELLRFLRDYYKDLYFMKRKDEMEEFMFLGLRLMEGISIEDFRKRFSVGIESVYGSIIDKYKKKGLLIEKDGRIFLSDMGIDVSNVIMAEFML